MQMPPHATMYARMQHASCANTAGAPAEVRRLQFRAETKSVNW